MSFFSRWFGSSHPLDEIRKASSQGRWADVLSFSSALEDNSLQASDQTQLRELVDVAAENLSRINFEEGLASMRADDFRRGMEHLDLARQLVRSSALRELIDAEFARIGRNNLLTGDMSSAASIVKSGCSSSCCGSVTEGHVTSYEQAGVLMRRHALIWFSPPTRLISVPVTFIFRR